MLCAVCAPRRRILSLYVSCRAQGVVYLGVIPSTGDKIAVKQIDTNEINQNELVRSTTYPTTTHVVTLILPGRFRK